MNYSNSQRAGVILYLTALIFGAYEKTLLRIIERKDINYMRLVPATVHILTLNGRIDKAIQVRAELTATITSSMCVGL